MTDYMQTGFKNSFKDLRSCNEEIQFQLEFSDYLVSKVVLEIPVVSIIVFKKKRHLSEDGKMSIKFRALSGTSFNWSFKLTVIKTVNHIRGNGSNLIWRNYWKSPKA